MYIQWCVKGIPSRSEDDPINSGVTKEEAWRIVASGEGIKCNWWNNVREITSPQILRKLTAANLDRHVNDYARSWTHYA
jgi:hypothetical protein